MEDLLRNKTGRVKQCTQDGKRQRKTKEEIQDEMMRLKEGLEVDEQSQRKEFVQTLKQFIRKEPTPEEIEQERIERENYRKKFLAEIRPKKTNL
jgi:hypothetical protein